MQEIPEEKSRTRIPPLTPGTCNHGTVSSGQTSCDKSPGFSLSHPIPDPNSRRTASDWADWVVSPPFDRGHKQQPNRPSEMDGGIDERKIYMHLQEAREWVLGEQKPRRASRVRAREDFSGGPVVKNLSFKAGDTSLIPGWGTKIPHAMLQQRPSTARFCFFFFLIKWIFKEEWEPMLFMRGFSSPLLQKHTLCFLTLNP